MSGEHRPMPDFREGSPPTTAATHRARGGIELAHPLPMRLALLAILVMTAPARADDEHRMVYVSTDLAGMAFGTFGVSAGYALLPKVAVRATVGHTDRKVADDANDTTRYGGWMVGIGVPMFENRAHSGWYFEPAVVVERFERSEVFFLDPRHPEMPGSM
jgi:hypothetical protein